ncbi:hypothetical protein LDENG_00203880 [Lucifuga dentata]|nr:hypothetical protein LDENG_00203880 [Lucifuga dentata]
MDSTTSDQPAIVTEELRRCRIDTVALSETHLADEEQLKEEKDGYTIFWKGKAADEPRIHSIGFAIKSQLVSHLSELPEDVEETFYAYLQTTLSSIPKEDKIILLGAFNTRVGQDHSLCRGIMGKEGIGNINSNRVLLLLLTKCAEYDLIVTNTLFHQKNKQKMYVRLMRKKRLRKKQIQPRLNLGCQQQLQAVV